MDQGNLPLHSGVKRDGCARNIQQITDGAQMYRNPEVKRVKVIHSRTLPSESFMPEPCNLKTVKDKRPSQIALDTNESGVPVTKVDLPNSEQDEPRRAGLRPRVRQRLSASAMAGNVFCTIAMIILTVSACAANPDIAIHPTAIQLDSVTRAKMLLSSDMREWKEAEEREFASMKSNYIFMECDLPAGRKIVKTNEFIRIAQ